MAVEVRLPAYSESMEEADVVGWLVAPGDRVNEGDPIAEIETDKATGELESPASGVLTQILVAEGSQGVKVGDLLALIEPALEAEAEAEAEVVAGNRTPSGEPAGPDLAGADLETPPVTNEVATVPPETKPQRERAASAKASPAQPRVSASALARRLAERAGLDLSTIAGSGASGRILKADIESASAAVGDGIGLPPANGGLQRGGAHAPALSQLQLRVECHADRAKAACDRLTALEPDTPIPLLALIVRAAAGALREVPEANAAWTSGQLVALEEIAVALDLTERSGDPTQIRDADRKSLTVLAKEIASAGPPASAEGVSALSIVDVADADVGRLQLSAASPCVCVLATAELGKRPIVVDGELAVAEVLSCTLAADTRAIDAKTAARLLAAFKLRLEDPLEMILH